MTSILTRKLIAGTLPLALLLILLAAARTVAQGNDDEIVYTDAAGVIRIHDHETVANTPTVGWFSPVGGYTHVALIDVQRDGDMEIAALRPSGGNTILDIYDPVISPDEEQSGDTINGIPWRLVNSLTFSGAPGLLAAGNLDPSVDGDELLLSAFADGDPAQQRLKMVRNTGGNGSRWTTIDLAIPPRHWVEAALGNMDGDTLGVAEIGLVSQASATVQIWRIGSFANVSLIYENANPARPWNAIAMGDWLGNGNLMLGAVRAAPHPFPGLVIFRLHPEDVIEDYYSEVFFPPPLHIWFGDPNGSLDDEVFMLRSVPPTDTVTVRVFSRNRGSDTTFAFADRLDADNGYQAGTAGDFDGDGRDEIALLRDNNLRLYLTPESNATPTNVSISSDVKNIVAGDLDRLGFVQTVQLRAVADTITPRLPAGGSGVTDTVQIQNATNALAIPFAQSIEGSPPWVSVTANRSTTPATLTFVYDATRLPPGTYRANLIVDAQSNLVSNNPLEVEVALVVDNGLLPQPNALFFQSEACTTEPDQTQSLQLIAGAGTRYQASLVAGQSAQVEAVLPAEANITWPSSVDWLTATSPSGIAPEVMALTASFDNDPTTFSQAGVVIFGTLGSQTAIRTVAVYRMCVASRTFMPLLMR